MTTPKINLLAAIQSAGAVMATNQAAHGRYLKAQEEISEAERLFNQLHVAAENALTAFEGEEGSVRAEHKDVIQDLQNVLGRLSPPAMPNPIQETPGAVTVASKLLEATRELLKDPKDAVARQRCRETVAQVEIAMAGRGMAVGNGEQVTVDLAAGTVKSVPTTATRDIAGDTGEPVVRGKAGSIFNQD